MMKSAGLAALVVSGLIGCAIAGCSGGGAPAGSGSGGKGSGGMAATGGSSPGSGGSGGAASGGAGPGSGGASAGSGGAMPGSGGRGSGGGSGGLAATGGANGASGGAGPGSGGAGPTGGRGGGTTGAGTGGSAGGASGAGGAPVGGRGGGAGAAGTAGTGREMVFVGSSSNDVSAFTFDTTTGALVAGPKTQAGMNPSFLAVEPTRKFLYAGNESSMQVASFSIDQTTGALTLLNRVSTGGASPAYVGVDRSGKLVMVANYGGGSTNVFKIGADGMIGASTDMKSPGTQSHMIAPDLTNKFVFVPCKGSDYIAQYKLDAAAGTLTANNPPHVMTKAGAGPRHIAMHPGGAYAYLINELDSTMNAYTLAADGTLAEIQSVSSLPSTFSGQNSGAEVVVSADGKFVYGSNRGHNSIVIFAIDAGTGKMTLVGHQSTGGSTPRSFTIDPSGGFLLVANQDSNNVVTFKVDRATGMLSGMVATSVPQGPQFVGVFVIPAP